MSSSLLQDWHEYCKDLQSPQSYIDMAFYSMIGAALQRRVWVGPTEMPIFSNLYVILVGDPATGKGLVLRPIKEMLCYWKQNSTAMKLDKLDEKSRKQILEAAEELRVEAAKKGEVFQDPLIFPMTADSTTYEQVVTENAKAIRTLRLTSPNEKMAPSGIYTHNSLIFLLPELDSLFKKHQEDVIKYLTAAFDGDQYEYKTKTQGTAQIRRPCLTFLAGTNPDFINESFSNKLIGGGFASRVIFVFEERPRFYRFAIPEFSSEQLECKQRIINRLKELSRYFGQVQFTPDALTFLKEVFENGKHKTNNNPRLEHYYGRKNLHVQKLAMAMHFADNNDMTIGLDIAKEALRILAELEIKMHLALSFGDEDNPLSKLIHRILKNLSKSQDGMLYETLWGAVQGHPMYNEAIAFLLNTNQIRKETFIDQKTGKDKAKYYASGNTKQVAV